jgi:hypothetical protein
MNIAAWQTWVMNLPIDPLELQQVHVGLQREVKQVEDRLASILASGGNSRTHRETLIELAELNSKLRVIAARLVV